MFAEKHQEVPLFDLAHLNRSQLVPEAAPGRRPEWKHRCELLLRYLQSHDLTRMPQALHQRLYVVLTEIARVLGDNLADKLHHQPRKWSETEYNLEEATKSFVFRESVPLVCSLVDRTLSLPCSLGVRSSDLLPATANAAVQTHPELPCVEQQSSFQLNQQLLQKNSELLQKQKEIEELRDIYRKTVLQSERFLIDEYESKQEFHQEIERLKMQLIDSEAEIGKLRGLLNDKDRGQLLRINSDMLKSRFELGQENFDEETLTMHSMSRPEVQKPKSTQPEVRRLVAKNSHRRPSVSVESGEQTDLTQFETEEGSEDSIRNPSSKVVLLQKRLEELESDLRMKDEVISAINSFIEKEGESIVGQKHCLTEILRRCELKEKVRLRLIQYKSYCSLAEENAYLKKCMDKLTRSEEFWSKLQDRQEMLDDERKKCAIF